MSLLLLTACTNAPASKEENALHLGNNDTLFIYACKSKGCGGEWGCCLELNKIYKTNNLVYTVKHVNGIRVWNKDTNTNSAKTICIKRLYPSHLKAIEDFLQKVRMADTLMVTSNGANRFIVKSAQLSKTIYRDDKQWNCYETLKAKLYKEQLP